MSPVNYPASYDNFADVQGRNAAKLALVLAVAHSTPLLLVGPPGAGKTMLAWRTPSIAPPMTDAERAEMIEIHQMAGTIAVWPDGLVTVGKRKDFMVIQPEEMKRPFRAPHHTASLSGMAGIVNHRGHFCPGEMSLAHAGILFMDEFPEFRKNIIDAVQGTIRNGGVVQSIKAGDFKGTPVSCSARFLLIAAMDPCPCGYRRSPVRTCVCSNSEVKNYWKRVPLDLFPLIELVKDDDGYADMGTLSTRAMRIMVRDEMSDGSVSSFYPKVGKFDPGTLF